MSRPELSEEEIRQLEAELDRITVDDVLLQTVVSLLNLSARKAGLAEPGTQPDLEQLRQGIEGARALLPLLEQRHGDKLGPVRDTLSQLQMVYARHAPGGQVPGGGPQQPQQPPQKPEGAPSAQQSGRLWVPGQ